MGDTHIVVGCCCRVIYGAHYNVFDGAQRWVIGLFTIYRMHASNWADAAVIVVVKWFSD